MARPIRLSRDPSRHADVLRAAAKYFSQKGYPDALIEEIAGAVGVLKGSIYYYIGTKEDLLWRIIEDVEAQSEQIINEVLALDVPAIDQIEIYIRRYVVWCVQAPGVSVSFREWRHLSGERLSIDRSRRQRREQVLCDLISSAQRAGDVSDLDPNHAARYILAAVNAVPDWYRPGGSDSTARIAESFADMTIGLLTGPPP